MVFNTQPNVWPYHGDIGGRRDSELVKLTVGVS